MINLLPPSHKEELRGEEQFRLVLILGMLLMAFFICLSLLLLSIRVYISGEIQVQQILLESQREAEGESRLQQIRQLNSDIAEASSFYESRVTLSDIIARISNTLPENVYLTSLTYKKPKIALAGFASQTEDLLQLRTSLEQDSMVKNFHFPASNWNKDRNINFFFDFEI